MRSGGKFTPWSIDIKHHYVTLKLCFFFLPSIEVFLSHHCRMHYSLEPPHVPVPANAAGKLKIHKAQKDTRSVFPIFSHPVWQWAEPDRGRWAHQSEDGTQHSVAKLRLSTDTMQLFRDDIKAFFRKDCIRSFLIHMHLQYQSCHVAH